jgi:hypothetical protein
MAFAFVPIRGSSLLIFLPVEIGASVARMERSEIRGGVDASRQSRITLRSIQATRAYNERRGGSRRHRDAKLFRLHSMPALLLPAEDSTMRIEMGIVAVLLLLDVAKDREHAIGHRIY